MQKRVLGLLITILLVIISIQFISSAKSCGIEDRTICTGRGGHVVMGVSDLTNAHGEFEDAGTYDYVLCCDFQEVRGITCIGTNKIIGLSSSTNAHAESPEQTNYLTDVCYDDLKCIRTSSSCPLDYSIPVLSLSNSTNAHIGASGDYSTYQICCWSSAVAYKTCELTDAFWEYEEVYEDTNVGLIVKGADCDRVRIGFEIYKKRAVLPGWVKIDGSPGDADFSGDTATRYWIAEEPGEFYFKAIVIEETSKNIDNKDNPLTVKEREIGYCDEKVICSNYTLEADCNEDFCDVAETSEIVDCEDSAINCSCSWDDETNKCGFAASSGGENGTGFGAGTCEYAQETTDDCSNGYLTYNFIANWTGLPEEKPAWCVNGTETIECSAQVQLPFFNTYSILIAIALIVLIYIILIRKKSSRKKRK